MSTDIDKIKLLNRPSKKFQKFISSGLTLADLRHSCASLLYANGVSLKEIQEWLGHSDIATTSNIYTHLDYSSKIASAEAIMGVYPTEKK